MFAMAAERTMRRCAPSFHIPSSSSMGTTLDPRAHMAIPLTRRYIPCEPVPSAPIEERT